MYMFELLMLSLEGAYLGHYIRAHVQEEKTIGSLRIYINHFHFIHLDFVASFYYECFALFTMCFLLQNNL